ncbi:MAG: SusC/RagA family TonB-linked outer membrane protein [Bacteroidales bacterium]
MAAQNNISLDMRNKPLKEVLAAITKATDYKFVYSDVLKEINQPVTIKCENQNLTSVLKQLFGDKKISYRIDGKNIALSPAALSPAAAQEKTDLITGVVVDEKGESIPGVTIWNKTANKYVSSDLSGKFQISGKEGDLLVFSSIGMESKEVKVGKSNNLKVTLTASVTFLENVVVTGYQDMPKERVTGSIASISSKKIEERYTANIMNNLEGRVAGLSTYGGKTTIRGTSSLYAETNPLVVVDGMPVESKIEDINPYDIESINILKDAASTAIYGARASNGIIVITTKNARKIGKIDIDFSSNLSIFEKRNMNYSDNFYMNAEQQVKLESDYYEYYFFNNEGEISNPVQATESDIEGGSRGISPIQYAYYQHATNKITRDQLNTVLNSLKKNNFAKEYGEAIYKRQVRQQYNLSLRNSSEKFQSNLIFNYRTDNNGIINSDHNQLNISYKGIYEVAPWLTATFGINGIYSKEKEAGNDVTSNHTNPWSHPAYETLYNNDGTVKPYYYENNGNQYWSSKSAEGLHDLGVNIIDEFNNNVQSTNRQNTRYHGNLLFKIFKGLSANVQYIYENEHTTTQWHANEASHVSRSIRNAYTTLEGGKVSYLTPRTGGMLHSTNTDGRYWTARGQIDYSNTFGKHTITALAGLEFRETKYNGTKSLVLGYDEQLQNSSTHVVDFGVLSLLTYAPYYMSGTYLAQYNVFNPYIQDGMGIVLEQFHRYGSGYANFTYTYGEKYNIFASFRKDYADVYGLNSKFRGKPLWSVGAGWNIHKESFVKNINWINFLKLRASYGVTGNIYQGATSYMTASSTNFNRYTNLPYSEVESPANPNLKWEQSRTTNIGVDYSLAGNRLRGTIDLYSKVGKNIFSNKTLDPTTGFTSMFANIASMHNKGIETTIIYDWFREVKMGSFGWTTGLTFSYNQNKITDVENASTNAVELIDNPYRIGYPTSALWSWRFAGISDEAGQKGRTLWYVEDGVKATDAQNRGISIMEYSGQSEPKIVSGIENRFTWKGFSLNIMMAYYGGHKIRALAELETSGVEYSTIANYFLNAWTPENPTTTPGIGRYGSTDSGWEPRYSDISVREGAFLKIRNLVFGYDLPEKWFKGTGVNRLSLRFQIDNPKYLWIKNEVGVDPETRGIRNPSSYIFGVNINL